MPAQVSFSRRMFLIINSLVLIVMALLCLLPMVNVLAVSLSSSSVVSAGRVGLWPLQFTLHSYEYALKRVALWRSFGITILRVALAIAINMTLTVITAYPLSKDVRRFRRRTLYVWVFFISTLFSGGLIPWFLVIRWTGLINTIWALVIPGALPVFYVILLLNFFRQVPQELEEAAFIDGAGHLTTLFQIYIPVSLPAIATLTLFVIVGHWNSWFDGMILMDRPENYPLQSYLRTLIIAPMDMDLSRFRSLKEIAEINDRTLKASQIFIGTIPILLVYPFLQKHFVKGIIIGSVKG